MKRTSGTLRMHRIFQQSYPGLILLCTLILAGPIDVSGQSISVGKGSYSTTIPFGEVGPQNFEGQNVSPKVSLIFLK